MLDVNIQPEHTGTLQVPVEMDFGMGLLRI